MGPHHFADILDLTTDAFVALDNNWCYTYMNKKAGEVFNRHTHQTTGKCIWTEFPDEVGQPFYIACFKAMETQQYVHLEKYCLPDGRCFKNNIYPSPEGLSVFFQEIIKQRKTAEIISADERLENLLKATNDAVWEWEILTGESRHNETFLQLFAEPGTGKRIKPTTELWKAKIHPDDRERVLSFLYSAINGAASKWADEFRFLKPDGSYGIYYDRGYIVRDKSGKAISMLGSMIDITEQKKAEEQREFESRDKLALINATGDLIWSVNKSLKLIAANQAFIDSLINANGIKLKPGDNVLREDIFPADVLLFWKELYQQALAGHSFTKEIFIPETETRTASWLEINFNPVHTKNEITGLACYARDITERKAAAEKISRLNDELSKNEKKFRSLIENSTDIISLLDGNLHTLYRTPSADRITGWTTADREKANGMEQTHPDDLPGLQEKVKNVLSNPGKPFRVSFRTRHKENRYIWLDGVMTNMLQDESVKAIVTNLRDISKTKEDEEKLARSEKVYKTIVSGIPGSAIFLFDTEYRYLLVEGDLLKKFGYEKDKLTGNKIQDVLPPESCERIILQLQKVFKGNTSIIESSSGGFDIVTRYVPLKDENNLVYAAMAVVIDISELKKAERKIIELNHELEQKVRERTEELEMANKELESFSYSVSHDLRAPLRAVSGYSGILIDEYIGKLDAEGSRILKAIGSNAKQMGQLIDDLLDFSRTGRKEISPHTVNMKSVAVSCFEELISFDIADKYTLHTDELPDAIADPAMLRQVWMNLAGNAIKYSMKKTNPVITIGFKDEEKNTIYFIKDNGAGFDMQYADKLFGVFQRMHNSEEFEGTGVGLALVSRIINKHRGAVWAEAIVNEGATFYFSLPKQINNENR